LKISKKIKNIERRKSYRKNKNSFYRLNMSERIFNFPDEIFNEFISTIDQNDIITYPSRFEYDTLKKKIAFQNDTSCENILLFPGSDVAIRNIFELTRLEKCETVTSDPCFPMYDVYSRTHHNRIIKAQYTKNLTLPNQSILDVVTDNTSLVVLANPNSPIGDWKTVDEISEICKYLHGKGIILLVDEAYVEFSPGSCSSLVDMYDNIIISRTFSKAAGCAGMRVGYTISSNRLKCDLEKLHFTFPITNLATKFSNILMDNIHVINDYSRKTIKERNELSLLLESTGFKTINSNCNWIHFRDEEDNDSINDILRSFGVDYNSSAKIPFDDNKNWIRLTVGPDIINTGYIKEILKA